MGRTYRRGGDESTHSYGSKSLREKRQKGKSKRYNSWDEDKNQKRKKSNKVDYNPQDWSL